MEVASVEACVEAAWGGEPLAEQVSERAARGGMPPKGDIASRTADCDKQQTKYDEKIKKMLSNEQYEGYLKLKLIWPSQRRIKVRVASGGAEASDGKEQPGLTDDQGAP